MMRLLLDTNIYAFMLQNPEALSRDVCALLEDYEMADLNINTAQNHKDPSDHIIIAQAIAHRMTLISADGKFPFYRNQGLDLVENK